MTETDVKAGESRTKSRPAADDRPETEPGYAETPGGRPARRFWSMRRGPAAAVALLGAVAAGALLYDTVAVRLDRPAGAWRRWLAGELATSRLDSGWVIGAGAAAAALGLGLLLLACTPGLRSVLRMRPAVPDIRAGLDRTAAALVLRDSALHVPGVAAARVAVSRRRVKARADVHFRGIEEVREELDEVLAEDLAGLGLVRPLPLVLDVRTMDGR